jgi:hypothetical protein
MGQTAGFAAGSWIVRQAARCRIGRCYLFSVYPETPGCATAVFDLETSNFSQGQENQGFERRRSTLRRTIKSAD